MLVSACEMEGVESERSCPSSYRGPLSVEAPDQIDLVNQGTITPAELSATAFLDSS